MSDFLTWLFGQKHEPLPPQPWPTAEDVASAREYKKKYGNFNEQDIEGAAPVHKNDETQPYRTRVPASAKAQMLPANKALDYLNYGRGASQPGLLSPEVADRLYAAQIAAQRNSVAALGFDTSRMIHTVDEPDRLSARGAYLPSDDKMWLGTNSPTTPVHESLHRGIEMLRRESPGSLNKPGEKYEPYKEEYLVRRAMKNAYGDAELNTYPRQGGQNDAQFLKILPSELRAAHDPQARNGQMDEYIKKQLESAANLLLAQKILARQGGVPW